MNDYGVKFHFTRDHLVIDKNSPMSEKDRFGIGVWMGKRYTDNLRLEVVKGMNERESRGYWNYKAPIGYLNIRKQGRAQVVLDSDTYPYIRQVFEMYVTGNYSQEYLTNYLKEKITSRSIGRTLVDKILSNPFYFGSMLVKGKILQGNHEAVIEKKLWDDCQRIRGIRAMGQDNTDKALVKKPLMGLLHCGECGSKVTGEVKRKSSGKQYIYYHCANTKCEQRRKNIRQEVIFEQIILAFRPFSQYAQEGVKKLFERLKSSAVELDLHCQKRLTELSERKVKISKKLLQLEELKDSGAFDEVEYQSLITRNESVLKNCKAEIDDFLDSQDSVFNKGLKVIELFQKAYSFMSLSDDLLAKAKMAKIVLSNPTLKDGSIGFSYENPFDNFTKNLTSKIWWAKAGTARTTGASRLSLCFYSTFSICTFGKFGYFAETLY